MGFFNFFNPKTPSVKVKELVWISQGAKLKGSMNLIKDFPDSIVVSWFTETQKVFSDYFIENGIHCEVKLARGLSSFNNTATVVFLEHYPIKSKEIDLMKNWDKEKITVLNSLDEPLFENFGSERIISLMKTMGMKEDEFIENTMISSAIENAQNKIERKISFDNASNSSKEWFEKNLPKSQ